VELGRRNALTTSKDAATNAIPKPMFTVPELIATFSAVGLDEKDVVSLSGTKSYMHPKKELSIAEFGNPNSVLDGCPGLHTIFQARLYNQGNTGKPDPSLDKPYLVELQQDYDRRGSWKMKRTKQKDQDPIKRFGRLRDLTKPAEKSEYNL
jgi:peroxidase